MKSLACRPATEALFNKIVSCQRIDAGAAGGLRNRRNGEAYGHAGSRMLIARGMKSGTAVERIGPVSAFREQWVGVATR
jgi:hypothetical protein